MTGCSTQQPGASVSFVKDGFTYGPCLTTGVVSSIGVTAQGSGYTSAPTVSIGGNGASWTTPAVATANLGGASIASVSVTNGGSGYTAVPSVTPSYGNATLTGHLTPTSVGSATVTNGGSGYRPTVTMSLPGGSGVRATATANVSGGQVVSLTITNAGSGYASAPSVAFAGGGGSGAAATATISGGSVTGFTITNGGSGYAATVSFNNTGTGGSGATATATLTNGVVASITITNGGSGYTSSPTITISGGGGLSATATAVLAGTSLASITITGSNNNYTSSGGVPTISIGSGGGGSGATATATLGPYKVSSITVSDPGSGYTGIPFVTLSGGGGTGATALASMAASCCIALPSAGTYVRTVTLPSFTTEVGNITVACGADHSSTSTLNVDSGHACAAPPCCPPSDCVPPGPCVSDFYPEIFYVDDGFGTVTLNRTIAGSSLIWQGTATRTASKACTFCSQGSQTTNSGVGVTIGFDLRCDTRAGVIAGWGLTLSGTYCGSSFNGSPLVDCLSDPSSGNVAASGPTGSVTTRTCRSFNESFTMHNGFNGGVGFFAYIYGSSNFTANVTR